LLVLTVSVLVYAGHLLSTAQELKIIPNRKMKASA